VSIGSDHATPLLSGRQIRNLGEFDHPWLVQRISVCILAVRKKIADNQIG
jgi:hypothetical protein